MIGIIKEKLEESNIQSPFNRGGVPVFNRAVFSPVDLSDSDSVVDGGSLKRPAGVEDFPSVRKKGVTTLYMQ